MFCLFPTPAAFITDFFATGHTGHSAVSYLKLAFLNYSGESMIEDKIVLAMFAVFLYAVYIRQDIMELISEFIAFVKSKESAAD